MHHDLIENNTSSASKNEIDGSADHHQEGAKFPLGGSPYSCQQKKVDVEGGSEGQNKKHQMPPASVMTRLILIMVWRKLIRNPNTYSSLFGLAWSLISFKYICY